MVNFRDANKSFVQDDLLNIKEYIFRFLGKWYWFALSIIAGLSISYLVFLDKEPVYQVRGSILVQKENISNTIASLFNESLGGGSSMIDNQIGIIKSYSLNREVMEKLNWRVNWYRIGLFNNKSLYKAEPFVVVETPEEINLSGVPINIKVLSSTAYQLTAKAKGRFDGKVQTIQVAERGKFGVPVNTKWFHFTLKNKDNMAPEVGAEYLFYFNDIKGLVNNYRNNLDVKLMTEDSEILVFTLTGTEPLRDIDYLNELIRSHMQKSLNEKNRGSENTIRFIDQQLAGISDSLSLSAQRFSDFRSSNMVIDLTQKGMLLSTKMAELESQKTLIEMRLKYFRNLQNYIGNAEQMKQVVAPSIVGVTDQGFNMLVTSMIELYRKREILSYSVNDLSPNLELLDKEIKLTSKSLNENLKNILINTESEQKQIDDQIMKVSKEMVVLPAIEQQLVNIRGRYEMNNEMNNFLLKKKVEAAITKASNSPDALTLDASLPETMVGLGPERGKFLIAGFLIGLLLPVLIIVIFDFFNDTIRSMEQLERRTNLPIIGTISHSFYESDNPVLEHPRTAIAESFRGLRNNLQFLMTDPSKNIISIHSTVPGEGKTFVSMNLATIIAMNSKKVLLVECDLRKPRLHKLADPQDRIGLSHFLIGKATLEEIVMPTKIVGLSYVPAGQIPPNPAELLESALFDEFLKEVHEKFDYIILDNPPISLITDSVAVGSRSDTNIFVLRQEYSHKDQIKFINEIAQHKQLKRVVLVLNDIKPKGYGYGGMKYSGYTYSNQYGGEYYSDSLSKRYPWQVSGKKKIPWKQLKNLKFPWNFRDKA